VLASLVALMGLADTSFWTFDRTLFPIYKQSGCSCNGMPLHVPSTEVDELVTYPIERPLADLAAYRNGSSISKLGLSMVTQSSRFASINTWRGRLVADGLPRQPVPPPQKSKRRWTNGYRHLGKFYQYTFESPDKC